MSRTFFTISWILIYYTHVLVEGSVHEICAFETFEAECPASHVIVISRALYGRMRVSQCVPAGSGSIGCTADVITYMDYHCSGRRQCAVHNDRALSAFNNCPRGRSTYLEIQYECIHVYNEADYQHMCSASGTISVPDTILGYIVSPARTNTVHLSHCAWNIEGQLGQFINITLMDFGVYRDHTTSGNWQGCVEYATISDTAGDTVHVCGGNQRVSHVFTSKSNLVQIEFSRQDDDEELLYIMKYEVKGCVLPPLEGNVIYSQMPERIVLKCEASGKIQTLTCKGNTWNEKINQCKGGWVWSPGILVVLCIGVAIGMVVGCSLFFCICHCIRTRKRTAQHDYYSIYGDQSFPRAPPPEKDMPYKMHGAQATLPRDKDMIGSRDMVVVGSEQIDVAIPSYDGYTLTKPQYLHTENEPVYEKPVARYE